MFPEDASYSEKETFFREKVTIYPVSCEPLAGGRSDIEWLDAVLAGGAKIVQLRDKFSDDLALYRKALAFRERTWKAGALFIVNNRVDIALLSKADGVHLGWIMPRPPHSTQPVFEHIRHPLRLHSSQV